MYLKQYIPFYKRNLSVAIPIMLSQAGQVSVQLIDTIMVGHIGTTELAAAAFASSVFTIGFVFGMGFTFGITPLVGTAFGEENENKLKSLLKNSLHLNIIVAFALTAILYSISFFMKYMGQPLDVLNLAIPYYRLLVFSMIPFLLFYTLKQFLEGLANTKVAMYITLFANLVNIVFNYLFIFGKFGFPEMGLNGAGLATLISRIIMPLLIFLWFINHENCKKYIKGISFKIIDFAAIIKLFKYSLPIGLQIIIEVIAFSFGGIMMGWIGKIPLAAHQVALGLASFTFMIATGIGSATTIRVSFQYGAKQFKEMRMATFASLHIILAYMVLTALIFLSLRNYLPMAFSKDPELIALASNLLLYAAIFQIVDGVQLVSISALRGISDIKYPLYASAITYGILSLGTSYIFAFTLDFGPQGIWIGFVVGLLLASILFINRFNKLSKQYMK